MNIIRHLYVRGTEPTVISATVSINAKCFEKVGAVIVLMCQHLHVDCLSRWCLYRCSWSQSSWSLICTSVHEVSQIGVLFVQVFMKSVKLECCLYGCSQSLSNLSVVYTGVHEVSQIGVLFVQVFMKSVKLECCLSVSYTHLTLPTRRTV